MFSFLKKITGGAAKDDGECCMGKMDCGDKKKAEVKKEMKMEGGCCGGQGHHGHEHGDDDNTTPKGACH